MATKCLQRGNAMTTRRENVSYDASGLPGVTLGKSSRPTPAEIRFLRRTLGWSGSSAKPW